jgi:glycosyltransferase involved in cell wall biosynthesis
MIPGFQSKASAPELACAVLSLGGDPRLVEAVRSIQAQPEPAELVVVNSGGGEPAARLRAAGIDVPVIDHPQPLFPGGARNLGIDATRAPYMAFLAADCRAEPGWAAARIRAHSRGADVVAGVLTNVFPESRIATASFLLTHHRCLAHIPSHKRLLCTPSYRRTLFERYGRFRHDIRTAEDTEFNQRLSEDVVVTWAPDVRTAHVYPTRLRELLRDQFWRGRRRAIAFEELGKPRTVTLARQALLNLPQYLRLGRDAVDPAERRSLLRARPLLLPGALAVAAGALSQLPMPGASGRPALTRADQVERRREAKSTIPETPFRSGA